MRSDQNPIQRLTKQWEKADGLWKEASKKSQEATAAYQWTVQDDGAKWNRVRVNRMREAIAFKKAEAARQRLVDFMRIAQNVLTEGTPSGS